MWGEVREGGGEFYDSIASVISYFWLGWVGLGVLAALCGGGGVWDVEWGYMRITIAFVIPYPCSLILVVH